jgi:hypothetical protein
MPRVRLGPMSLDVPEDWTLSSVILAGPRDSEAGVPAADDRSPRPFQRNVIISLEQVSSDETPDVYFERQEKGLGEAGVESGLIGDPEEVELGGGAWCLLSERVIVSSEGERVRQMQLITIKDKVAFTVIASHLDGIPFEAVREEFRKILESFEQAVAR